MSQASDCRLLSSISSDTNRPTNRIPDRVGMCWKKNIGLGGLVWGGVSTNDGYELVAQHEGLDSGHDGQQHSSMRCEKMEKQKGFTHPEKRKMIMPSCWCLRPHVVVGSQREGDECDGGPNKLGEKGGKRRVDPTQNPKAWPNLRGAQISAELAKGTVRSL